MSTTDRAWDLAQTWRRDHPDTDPVFAPPAPRWRVAPDVRVEIVLEAIPLAGSTGLVAFSGATTKYPDLLVVPEERLFGWGLDVDEDLPAGTILLSRWLDDQDVVSDDVYVSAIGAG